MRCTGEKAKELSDFKPVRKEVINAGVRLPSSAPHIVDRVVVTSECDHEYISEGLQLQERKTWQQLVAITSFKISHGHWLRRPSHKRSFISSTMLSFNLAQGVRYTSQRTSIQQIRFATTATASSGSQHKFKVLVVGGGELQV